MNILVTGANGLLGKEMVLLSANSEDRYVFTDIDELDITNWDSYRILNLKMVLRRLFDGTWIIVDGGMLLLTANIRVVMCEYMKIVEKIKII